MEDKIEGKLSIAIVISLFIIAFSIIILAVEKSEDEFDLTFSNLFSFLNPPISFSNGVEGFAKFSSEQEFKTYLTENQTESYGYGLGGGMMTKEMVFDSNIALTAPPTSPISQAGNVPDRVSGTNVQVLGIDEPDMVKTNGTEIYFSAGRNWGYREFWGGGMMPYPKSKIQVVSAFPPADLASLAEIDNFGDLLLNKNVLVVMAGQDIYGYDINDPGTPEKKWNVKLNGNNSVVEARLYDDKIYLVTKQNINTYKPCPLLNILSVEGVPLTIACEDIYHPISPVPVDVAFVAMVINPETGKVEKKTSFVGSSGSSVIYMSEQGIYATYSYLESMIKFYSGFLKEEGGDLFPGDLVKKVEQLDSYDISQQSKMTEFTVILTNYINSLDNDQRLKMENEMSNRMESYYKKHRRELEKTGIVKVELKDLQVIASGSVPGYPLNQFALDEYKGNLRIATTIGERWNGFISSRGETANDVYILNSDLKIQGAVQDLGLGERIYSVRFLQDEGYVVTFRQTDPFYVLDLSDPQNPAKTGELKIPGYSSYLHPVAEKRILGVGQESWKVKLSLFDVSSPSNPQEVAKYLLDDSWSDVLSTHHAFLQDSKHQIFFLPGSKGGYIFSYKDDKLELVKAVNQSGVRRAVYINDYLYIISDSKISVLNEKDWERVNELSF
ncbi:MAG: beta-propeller domain-containing protein [bacterium]